MSSGVSTPFFVPTAGATLDATLASHIRSARKRRGWTQSDLARESGVHLNTISQVERHEGDPRLSTVRALMQVLDIKLMVVSEIHPPGKPSAPAKADVPPFLRPSGE
jgi:ribosome-binding protein aMBF1 (putative translation factor)